MEKYIFLCSMGQHRSPTVARVARDIAKQRGLDITMDYDGVDNGTSRKDLFAQINSYDRVFVMEPRMITERLPDIDSRKIRCLYIDDVYNREDPELVRIIEKQLRLLLPE